MRNTAVELEHYEAKHMGLVPARFAPCKECRATIDLNLMDALRRYQHDPDCTFRGE